MVGKLLTLALLAFGLLLAVPSSADTFTWAYSGPGVDASGTFITDPLSNGAYQITSISGERNGEAITGLSDFGLANNLLYTTLPNFDFFGLSYIAGGIAYNLYGGIGYNDDGPFADYEEGYLVYSPTRQVVNTQVSFTFAPVGELPEPSSMLLVSTGLLLAVGRGLRGRNLRNRA